MTQREPLGAETGPGSCLDQSGAGQTSEPWPLRHPRSPLESCSLKLMENSSPYAKSFPFSPSLPHHTEETSEHSLFLYNRALTSVSLPSSLPNPLAWGCILCLFSPQLAEVLATGERREHAPAEDLQLPCPLTWFPPKVTRPGLAQIWPHAQALPLPGHAPQSLAFPWMSASSCFL